MTVPVGTAGVWQAAGLDLLAARRQADVPWPLGAAQRIQKPRVVDILVRFAIDASCEPSAPHRDACRPESAYPVGLY